MISYSSLALTPFHWNGPQVVTSGLRAVGPIFRTDLLLHPHSHFERGIPSLGSAVFPGVTSALRFQTQVTRRHGVTE